MLFDHSDSGIPCDDARAPVSGSMKLTPPSESSSDLWAPASASRHSNALPTCMNEWQGPAKTRTVVNGLTFRSDFDSGNLMKVVGVERPGAGTLYQLWTARDCEGGPNTKRNSSWFYFGVAGGSRDEVITMRLMNLNNQHGLYKNGMTPVYRQASSSHWARLKQKVAFEETGRHLQLQFQYRLSREGEEVFFAFCFPFSYEDCQRDLEQCEEQARKDGCAVQPLLIPKAGPAVYYHRDLLIHSTEGRRVDLITITDCTGMLENGEQRVNPHIFPERSKPRPLEFSGKDVVFVSARVHPGETPSSFVLQGILRFLLSTTDPRAAQLRHRFVFKLVPLLNPDGVAAGHFRQDTNGNNLNRHYSNPDPREHSPVFAAKSVVMHYAQMPAGRGRLSVYLDLHAHASTRGCFIYGNHLPTLEDQVENQLLPLLMTVNSAHFQYASCNFSERHMTRVDSGDGGLSAEGTGRVFYGRHAGVVRSYTLECNYNCGKSTSNHIPAVQSRQGHPASPERLPAPPSRYTLDHWREVGRGFLTALLDMEGANPWSRVSNSKFCTLERARRYVTSELRSQPPYREQSLLLRQQGPTHPSSPRTPASSAFTRRQGRPPKSLLPSRRIRSSHSANPTPPPPGPSASNHGISRLKFPSPSTNQRGGSSGSTTSSSGSRSGASSTGRLRRALPARIASTSGRGATKPAPLAEDGEDAQPSAGGRGGGGSGAREGDEGKGEGEGSSQKSGRPWSLRRPPPALSWLSSPPNRRGKNKEGRDREDCGIQLGKEGEEADGEEQGEGGNGLKGCCPHTTGRMGWGEGRGGGGGRDQFLVSPAKTGKPSHDAPSFAGGGDSGTLRKKQGSVRGNKEPRKLAWSRGLPSDPDLDSEHDLVPGAGEGAENQGTSGSSSFSTGPTGGKRSHNRRGTGADGCGGGSSRSRAGIVAPGGARKSTATLDNGGVTGNKDYRSFGGNIAKDSGAAGGGWSLGAARGGRRQQQGSGKEGRKSRKARSGGKCTGGSISFRF